VKFEVLTPAPIEMRAGTLIDYRIRLYDIPMRWRTEIAEWQPPYRFSDLQLRGPLPGRSIRVGPRGACKRHSFLCYASSLPRAVRTGPWQLGRRWPLAQGS